MFKKTVVAALVAGAMMSAHADDKVKIGFVSTLSGPAAALGTAVLDGFNLALKKNGGKLGGVPVEMIVQDDQSKPDVARQIGEKFIKKDKVDFVTGVIFQNILGAIDQATFASQTFLVSPNSGPSYLAGERCNPYFFAVSWISDSYAEAAGQLVSEKGHKSAYLIAPNYPGGKDVVAGFKRYYKGKVADEIYTKLGQLDYGVELSQIRAAKPDAVFIFLPGGMGINFIKQFVDSGLSKSSQLFGPGFSADEDIIKAVGAPMLGMFNASQWGHDMDNPQNKRFVADFVKKYGRLPSLYASQGYDAAMLMDSAVRGVKGKIEDKEALGKALKAANFKSVRGPFKFNNNNYPVQDYYARVIGTDKQGRITNRTLGTILTNHGDAYAASCKM